MKHANVIFYKLLLISIFQLSTICHAQTFKNIELAKNEMLNMVDSANIHLKEMSIFNEEITSKRYARIKLKSGITARGFMIGYNKLGAFLATRPSGDKTVVGFYPFAEMDKFSFGTSYGHFVVTLTAFATVVTTLGIYLDDPSDFTIGLIATPTISFFAQMFYGPVYALFKAQSMKNWKRAKIIRKTDNLYQFMQDNPFMTKNAIEIKISE